MKPGLNSGSSILIISSVCRYISQFVLLVCITASLGDQASGTYILALAVSAPIFVIFGMDLRTIYLTYNKRTAFSVYSQVRNISLALAVTVSCLIAFFLNSELGLSLVAVSLIKVSDLLRDLSGVAFQKEGRYDQILKLSLISSALSIIVSTSIFFSYDLVLTLFANAGVQAIFWVVCYRPTSNRVVRAAEGQVNGELESDWKPILKSGITLGFSSGVTTYILVIPQYVLGYLGLMGELTILGFLMYVYTAVSLVMNALNQANLPHFAAEVKAGRSIAATLHCARVWSFYALAIASTALACLVIATSILLNASFSSIGILSVVLVLILAVSLAWVVAVSTLCSLKNYYGVILLSNMLVIGITTVLSVMLVPSSGLSGALTALVAAEVSRFILIAILIRVKDKSVTT